MALVTMVLRSEAAGLNSRYVGDIGVCRPVRGRGVAKALLNTVVGDAVRRGLTRVGYRSTPTH